MKNNHLGRFLLIITLLLITVSISLIASTYALLESNAEGNATMNVGKWYITIDNEDITNLTNTNMTLTNFIYSESSNIDNGYIAPSRSCYYDLVIDPQDTDVAIRFDITFLEEEEVFPENIIYSAELLNNNNVIQTGENTYSGVISLEDIENNAEIVIRVSIEWINDEDYDETDTNLGIIENKKVNVPISLRFSQYLGESFEEYNET